MVRLTHEHHEQSRSTMERYVAPREMKSEANARSAKQRLKQTA